MNRTEAVKLLALIKVAYPYTYKDMDDASLNATVNMWHSTFSDIPYPIIELAFDHFRKISKHPPAPADIFDELKALYWRAVSDYRMLSDYSGNMGDRKKRIQYVISQTSRFSGSIRHPINYGIIQDNLIGTKSEQPMLNEINRG